MSSTTILIAEDDERLLFALKIRFEAMGFHVIATTNGQHALEMARQQPPDLLVLDINMPGYDGFGLVEVMDAIPTLTAIPVIYISGAVDEQLLQTKGERMGAIATIRKPFEIDDLIQSVRLVLPPPECAA